MKKQDINNLSGVVTVIIIAVVVVFAINSGCSVDLSAGYKAINIDLKIEQSTKNDKSTGLGPDASLRK